MRPIQIRIEPDAPAALALLRIAVTGIVVTSPEVWSSMALDATIVALRTPPEGLGWFAVHVPITPGLIALSRVLVAASALSALVGFYARRAFAVSCAASFYLFGCSELVGAARHNMHLFWFTALLAVSPCASRWSVDAARGRAVENAGDATLALWFARGLLSLVYFFPGYFKLREAGLDWALSDNLRNQMYWKWFQNAWVPSIRIDGYPALVRAGAGAVMLLELGFPILILGRRTRMLAAAGGVAFHLFAEAFMRLGFSSLWWCYAPLLDIRRLLAWLHDDDAPPQDPVQQKELTLPFTKRALPIVVTGSLLLCANTVQGFRGAVQAWPFACYPTFQYEAGTAMPDLIVTAVTADGAERTLLGGTRGLRYRDPREWGIVWRAFGAYGGAANPAGLGAFYDRLSARGDAAKVPPGARALRFYRGEFSVLPEHRGHGPVRTSLVGETPLSGSAP